MSALEIMDPQMDTGMATADLPPPADHPHDLSHAKTIALLDELLVGEAGWYAGLPLTKTLFRNDLLHNTRAPTAARLHAVLLGAVRSVAAIRSLVLHAGVSEEEDFVLSASGLDLREEVSQAEVHGLLVDAGEEAQQELERLKGNGSSGGDNEDAAERVLLEALCWRLQLRRALFMLFTSLRRPGHDALETVRSSAGLALGLLSSVRKTLHLGTDTSELDFLEGRASSKLLGNAPQRAVVLPSREEAVAQHEVLLRELLAVGAISEVTDYDALHAWSASTLRTAMGGLTDVSIVTRSYASLAGVTEERGTLELRPPIAPMVWAAVCDLNGLGIEACEALRQLEPCAERIEQLGQAEVALLMLRYLNRGRERRRLRHHLQDWAPLQELADMLDSQLQQSGYLPMGLGPFGCWVLAQTLRTMRRFLLLGFELELYSTCEYQMVYWYVERSCEVRLQLQRATSQRAVEVAAAAAAAAGPTGTAARSKSTNKKKSRGQQPPAAPAPVAIGTLSTTQADVAYAAVASALSRGLVMLLELLRRGRFMPPADSEFSPLGARFAERFAVFEKVVHPGPLSYAHFCSQCADPLAAMPQEQLATATVSTFKEARAVIDGALQRTSAAMEGIRADELRVEQRAELTKLARIAVANAVFIASNLTPPPADGSRRARFDFALHARFPVVSLV